MHCNMFVTDEQWTIEIIKLYLQLFFWISALVFYCCARNHQTFCGLKQKDLLSYISKEKEAGTPLLSLCSLCHLDEIKILVSTAITCSSGPPLSSVIVSRIQFPVTEGLRSLLSYLSLTNGCFQLLKVPDHFLPSTLVCSFKTTRRIYVAASFPFDYLHILLRCLNNICKSPSAIKCNKISLCKT